jgi:hypothetical protein
VVLRARAPVSRVVPPALMQATEITEWQVSKMRSGSVNHAKIQARSASGNAGLQVGSAALPNMTPTISTVGTWAHAHTATAELASSVLAFGTVDDEGSWRCSAMFLREKNRNARTTNRLARNPNRIDSYVRSRIGA